MHSQMGLGNTQNKPSFTDYAVSFHIFPDDHLEEHPPFDKSAHRQCKADTFYLRDEDARTTCGKCYTGAKIHFLSSTRSCSASSKSLKISRGVATFSPRSKRICVNIAKVESASPQKKTVSSQTRSPTIENICTVCKTYRKTRKF